MQHFSFRLFFDANYLLKTKPAHIHIHVHAYTHTHTQRHFFFPPNQKPKISPFLAEKSVYAASTEMAIAVSGSLRCNVYP